MQANDASDSILQVPRLAVYLNCYYPKVVYASIIIVCIGLLTHFFAFDPKYFNDRYKDVVFKSYKDTLEASIGQKPAYSTAPRNGGDGADARHLRLVEISKQSYDEKYKLYKERCSDVNSIFKIQAVVIVLSFLFMRYGETITLKFLGIDNPLPSSFVTIVIPISTFWLFYQFGYLLDSAMALRVILYHLCEIVGDVPPGNHVGPQGEFELFTLRSSLDDAGFIDNWFAASSRTDYLVAIKNRETIHLLILRFTICVYLGFYGCAHACGTVLIYDKIKENAVGSKDWYFWMLFLAIVTGVTLATHVAFYMGGNANWYQASALVAWCVFIYAFSRFRHDRTLGRGSGI